MQLSRLVLPAPFGPMIAWIVLGAIEKEMSVNAVTPPKRRWTPSIRICEASAVGTPCWSIENSIGAVATGPRPDSAGQDAGGDTGPLGERGRAIEHAQRMWLIFTIL